MHGRKILGMAIAVLFVMGGLFSACGDDDENGQTTTTTTEVPTTTTTTITTTTTTSPTTTTTSSPTTSSTTTTTTTSTTGPTSTTTTTLPGPTLIPGGFLDPTDCETYIGAHPIVPGQSICGPGGNELCVVEFIFCDDGTAHKSWDPDPVTGQPGPIDSTSGTWSVDPVTKVLTIVTTAPAMGGVITMETTEVYDSAFTYDGGNKLDLNSAKRVPAGDGSSALGNYERHSTSTIEVTGFLAATIDANVDTVMAVANGTWDALMQTDMQCTGSPLVCGPIVSPPDESTSGIFTMPGELYHPAGSSYYIMQVDDSLVFDRQ